MKWFLVSFLGLVLLFLAWEFLVREPLLAPPETTLSPGGKTSSSPTSSPGKALSRAPGPLAGAPAGVERNEDTRPGGKKKEGRPLPAGQRPDPVLAAALGEVLKEGLSMEERGRLWEDLARRGLLEDVLRLLEEKTNERPEDARLLLLLGEGARKMAALAPEGPKRDAWVEKADHAYERALAGNPENWEARFGRAALLASTPAGAGRLVDGKNQLQELLRWQEDKPSKPAYSRTYLLLGDVYAREGNREEARRVWEQGLARFPENQDLRKRLER